MSKINHYNYVSACPDVPTSCSSSFSLITRQQPIHARISTNNERDRRPIDPPPIIQIRFNNATPQQTDTFHQNPYFFMCANLAHLTNDEEIYTPTHNALSGQSVSSMYKLKDIDNHDGAFFVFGDVSVKVEGVFRLKLSLFEITSTGAVCLNKYLFTSPFTVYSTKKFPGMLDSTFLSRSFSDQGARIRIRKENRAQVSTNTSTTSSIFCPSRKRKLEIQTAVSPQEEHHTPTAFSPPQHQQYSPIAPTATADMAPQYYQQATHVAPPTTPPAFIETAPLSRTSSACNNAPYYCERRASVTSSGTECSTESTSPAMTHFSSSSSASSSSPHDVSLPPLSPPQQFYDKIFGTATYPCSSLVTIPTSFDPTVKLPPLRNLVSFANNNKRQKITSNTEQVAILAMMQLSSSSTLHHRSY